MRIKTKLLIGLLLGASALVSWPLIRNEIVCFQLRRSKALDGYLTIWDEKRVKHGPVRLDETQKQALLNLLDWDYTVFGRSLRGSRLCMTTQELNFASPNGNITISIYPNCGDEARIQFTGWANVAGYVPVKKVNVLQNELFPDAVKPK